MTSTILVVGATGNTGKSVVETLSKLLPASKNLSDYRILAVTRSSSSPAAQQLAKLPAVEVTEQNWVEITDDWLRQHKVVRVFVASHNLPNQFAEESQFYVNALRAGVTYAVRISTTAANVHPDCWAYYPRTHWAIEALLGQPEFQKLQWTSLQPNVFAQLILSPAVEFIKEYRKSGKQGTLKILLDSDTPVGVIDPNEVGAFAAHLLVQDDVGARNKRKYVLNGPEDVTGRQVIKMVEGHIGVPVEKVEYKDVSFIDGMADQSSESRNVILSIKYAPITAWEGKATTSTTSKEVLEIAPPQNTVAEVAKGLWADL